MGNGEKVVLNLNYDIVFEKMVFLQNEKKFDITNINAIDTVYINGLKFIPSGKVFFEVAVNAPVSLFVQQKGEVKKPSHPAAYGGTSEVSSSTYINNTEIVIEKDPIFWISKNGQLLMASGKKNLMKLFADKKNEMKSYIRANLLNIDNQEDMKKIITFYNGLFRQSKSP
jgi:hypothetical protein